MSYWNELSFGKAINSRKPVDLLKICNMNIAAANVSGIREKRLKIQTDLQQTSRQVARHFRTLPPRVSKQGHR
jgi:hypothetical protein